MNPFEHTHGSDRDDLYKFTKKYDGHIIEDDLGVICESIGSAGACVKIETNGFVQVELGNHTDSHTFSSDDVVAFMLGKEDGQLYPGISFFLESPTKPVDWRGKRYGKQQVEAITFPESSFR